MGTEVGAAALENHDGASSKSETRNPVRSSGPTSECVQGKSGS